MPHHNTPPTPVTQLPGSCCAPPNWRRLNCGSGCCCLFVVAAATGGCWESERERVGGGAQQIPPKTMQHASWQAVRQTSANFACKQEQDFYFLFFSLLFSFFFHSHRVANVQKIKCKKFKWIFVLQPLFCYFLCYFFWVPLCVCVCVCWSDNKILRRTDNSWTAGEDWAGDMGKGRGCKSASLNNKK